MAAVASGAADSAAVFVTEISELQAFTDIAFAIELSAPVSVVSFVHFLSLLIKHLFPSSLHHNSKVWWGAGISTWVLSSNFAKRRIVSCSP